MSISRDDVKSIAHLARLSCTESELERTTEKFSHVIDLVEQINQYPTDGITPMAHPLSMKQRLREDAVTEPDQRERFQQEAPASEAGLYLVPQVIDESN